VIGSDPEVTSLTRSYLEVPVKGQKTRVYCTSHFLQGYRSQQEAVAWQGMTSRDLR